MRDWHAGLLVFTAVQDARLGFSSVVKCLPSKPKALGSVLSFKKRRKKEKDKMQEDSDLVYTQLQTMAVLPRSQYIKFILLCLNSRVRISDLFEKKQ